MATVTGYDAERMKKIEDETVVGGSVNSMGNLILQTRQGTNIDAGNLRGPTGPTGPQGVAGGTTAQRDAFYGVPSTEAEKSALANKYPVWYNQDSYELETYRATTGTSGLIATGITGPSGWYQLDYIDRVAKGRLYSKKNNSSTGWINTAIVENIPSFYFEAGRNYRIVWDTSYLQENLGDLFFWSINLAPVADAAASQANLTVLDGRTRGILAAVQTTQAHGPITAYYTPTVSGTSQIKFFIQQVVGTNRLIVIGQGNEFARYLIYDDGMQVGS